MSSIPFNPLASSAPLIIYIDYKSPYAYLAKDPTYAIQDELGIEIDWRPFTLDIPSYLGSARLDQQGRLVESQRSERQWSVVRYSYRDVRRYGLRRGLIVRGTTKIWNSSLAAIGMWWAKDQGDMVLRRYSGLVYERFWKRELDIEDLAVIEGVLQEAGAQTTGFQAYATGEGRTMHDDMQRAAFDAGIFGVPTYVTGGEVLFGREHLPRIRWILSGRAGAAPDIAYEHDATEKAMASPSARGPLSVAIDFKSPSAYLAIGPTCELAEQLGVSIDWQPFQISPWKDHNPASRANDRGVRHRRSRADYTEREVIRYAADHGLVIRGLHRQTDSSLAAIGLLWTRRGPAALAQTYVQRVFERYWREELDIEDERALSALLAEIGAPVAGFTVFAREEGRAELERLQSESIKAGLFEVPTYLLDGDMYVGRQHLPLIRALLTDGNDKSTVES
ncbi:MAG: DsbA family protein [Deltaproteobacteria bacterium]|nr:DsbA family protein [Deltaproteobacteria bacterium]